MTETVKECYYRERAEKVIARLVKKNINAQYLPTRQEALSVIMGMIPLGAKVACSDSMTMDQVGVLNELRRRKQNEILHPMERDENGHYVISESDQRLVVQRQTFSSDIFLCGTNAITLDGKMVSTDALGNRVSAMIFGPTKVIIAVGANKIVADVDEALERVSQVAAPQNAMRHYIEQKREEYADVPCVKTGVCVHCEHEWKICRITVIIDGTIIRSKGRLNVVLIGEDLGL
jgi:hypothetical protein